MEKLRAAIQKYDVLFRLLLLQAFCLPLSIKTNGAISIGVMVVWLATVRWTTFRQTLLSDRSYQLTLLLFFAAVPFFINTEREHMSTAWMYMEKRLPMIILSTVLFTFPWDGIRMRKVLLAFVWGCVAVCIFCLAVALYKNFFFSRNPYDLENSYYYYYQHSFLSKYLFLDYFTHVELTSPVGIHPSYFSIYLTFCTCIGLYYYYLLENRKVGLVLAVFQTLMVLLLASRFGVIIHFMVLIALIAFIAVRKKQYMALIISAIFITGFLAISPVAKHRIFDQILEPGNYTLLTPEDALVPSKVNGINQRLVFWSMSAKALRDYWGWGTGIGDFQSVLNKEYAAAGYPNYEFDCHNQFLEEFLAKGIVGLVVFVVYMLHLFKVGWRLNSMLFNLFLIVFFSFLLVESALATSKGIMFFCFFGPILLAANKR
jgi:O-antigen ligase